MKNRKWLPILLMIWPYLTVALMYLVFNNENEFQSLFLLLMIILTAVVYILNIVNASTRKSEDACQLAFWDMLMKLVHIPFYMVMFVFGLLFLLTMVVPALILVSPIIVIALAVIDFCLMITTSFYGINALIRARANGIVSTRSMILHIIMHLFFVLDVISAIVVFVKLKKAERGRCDATQA